MRQSAPSERSFGFAPGRRTAMCAGALTLALSVGGALAPGADAKSETLHFFQKTVTNDFFNAAGRPIQLDPPTTVPEKGDRLDETDLDYAGTVAHHAGQWTATDHLSCTFTADAFGVCSGEIAVGSSMLLLIDDPLQFGPGALVLKVTGGTGVFQGAPGTVTSVNVGNDANLTVKLA
jgi:hypothetical protein